MSAFFENFLFFRRDPGGEGFGRPEFTKTTGGQGWKFE
jgi:hypothetical protein